MVLKYSTSAIFWALIPIHPHDNGSNCFPAELFVMGKNCFGQVTWLVKHEFDCLGLWLGSGL